MSNPHYAKSGSPVSRSRGRSDVMRDEFGLIEEAFDNVEAELQQRVTTVNPTSSGDMSHSGSAIFAGEVRIPVPLLEDDSNRAAPTTWVRALLGTISGGGGGDPLPPKVGKGGSVLATDGTTNYWQGGGSAAVSLALLQQGII